MAYRKLWVQMECEIPDPVGPVNQLREGEQILLNFFLHMNYRVWRQGATLQSVKTLSELLLVACFRGVVFSQKVWSALRLL